MTTHYITTPIYYVNDVPHIGHAYATVAADAVVRYHRLRGRDTFLLTGTDEHGINIERIAAARGIPPQAQADTIVAQFKALWSTLDIQYDRFIRTTEPAHTRVVLEFWRRLQASGDLYRGSYEGLYCARCEAFYQPEDLIDSRCAVHQLPCDVVSEQNWFFRLSAYQERLEQLVRETDFVQPESRRNEVLGILKDGLRDFSVSRRQVTWGIPVPETPDEVLYVWVDALTNYLTGIGFPDANYEHYWPSATHLVGKEIIRFHCLYWPALLLSAGLPLPKRVFAHGWLTKDGQKISKTSGNIIDPGALAAEFGSDAVRHYFLRGIPFGQDGDFTRTSFIARYNADLANDFGNLVQRTTTLAARHRAAGCDSGLDSPADPANAEGAPLRREAQALAERSEVAYESLALHDAAAAVGAFVTQVNRYIDAAAPWRETDPARLDKVLQHIVGASRVAAWYYAPIIPRAAAEAHRRLVGTAPRVCGGTFECEDWHRVESGEPLFPRVRAA